MSGSSTHKITSTTLAVVGACNDSYCFIYEIMSRGSYLARLSLMNYVIKLIQNILFERNDLTMPDIITRKKTSTILAVIGSRIFSYWFTYEIITRVRY